MGLDALSDVFSSSSATQIGRGGVYVRFKNIFSTSLRERERGREMHY
jgi:hypothetical protein